MSILTKQEFAERCGLTTKKLSTYHSRGKVIYTDEGRLNDSLDINKAFLIKHSQKVIAKLPLTASEEVSVKPGIDQVEANEYARLEKEKLKEQVEKLKNENSKLRLGNEKTVGKFVEVDLVKGLIVQLSEAIHLAWENELEDFILKFASQNGLAREEITKLKMEKNNSVNSSKTKAISHAKAMLRDMQLEAGTKRGVGEHD